MPEQIVRDRIDYLPIWPDHFHQGLPAQLIQTANILQAAFPKARLLLANYQPKLRTLLAEAGLGTLSYWTAFDQLQQVSEFDQQPLALADFTWPAGARFVRLYDRVTVLVGQRHYATVFFHYPKASVIDRINLLDRGQIAQQLTIDDRGFVSRVLTFEAGEIRRADYLNPAGAVVMSEDYQTGAVRAQLPDGHVQDYANLAALQSVLMKDYLQQATAPLVTDYSLQHQDWLAQSQRTAPVHYLVSERAAFTDLSAFATLAATKSIISPYYLTGPAGLLPARLTDRLQMAGIELATIANQAVSQNTAQAQPKEHCIIYVNLQHLQGPDRQALLDSLLALANEYERFVFILEAGAQLPVAQQYLQEQLAHLTALAQAASSLVDRFVWATANDEESRQAFLQTATAVVDWQPLPDLSLASSALALGLGTLTRRRTVYQYDEALVCADLTQLRAAIIRLLDPNNREKGQQLALEQRVAFDQSHCAAHYRQLIGQQ
ncbi:accessory Sec system glycosyltransferase Asp1 [Leuconostocaceae bacterium ESL0958]|nr:accessory Sec system glycosyltransferase Asp1 [Leuconostocaceae bacterium ESL0958]